MIGETGIPEKETEVIKVTLDEIEIAIANINVARTVLLSAVSLYLELLDAEDVKKAAAALDKNTDIALNSMTMLRVIMKQHECDKTSGNRTQDYVIKFCGYCKYYQPDKNTYVCTNKESGNFNINPAPFQHCSYFSKNKELYVK